MKKLHYLLLLTFLTPTLFIQCTASRKLKMSNQNADTIRLWYEEGWNKNNNLALIERVFAPDWEDGNPIRGNQTEGWDGIRQLVLFYYKAFGDTHFTITHLLADDKHAAIRYEVSAVHIGEAFGIPATGKKFTASGIVVYDMDHGKIKRSWQELDENVIIKQLKGD